MSNNIRVPGYVQKVVFNGNIEYRNFSPDLVGVQLTSDGGTPLFTMGNFSITTNMDPKLTKNFSTHGFSQFYSLSGLNLNVQQTQVVLDNTTGTTLNLDKTKLKNYALFGSLTEFTRVSLEDIITTWPASLFVNSIYVDSIGTSHVADTFETYSYDEVTDVASFRVNNTLITNRFDINFLINGTIADSFNETNDLRNMTVNFASYVIPINNIEHEIVGFTGSTELTNDYLYFQVKGNLFSGQSSIIQYHIRPSNLLIDTFFKSLDDYQAYLLNRQSNPLYTATFKYAKRSDTGNIIYTQKSVTWPVVDGYNIDFETGDYLSYASDLLTIATDSDSTETNLMVRFFVSESITSFDTIPVILDEQHQDSSGQKVTKLLTLYGREYDEINKFINGISFAHSVSYDKQDNTPDKYLKDLARVLGWDLISSVTENDLLRNFVSTKPSEYSGHSRSLTPVEADVELWRRLILNSPWLWKSKGARKSIEFLLKFIGTPQGLVEFNEYIYQAKKPIDTEVFQEILFLLGRDIDLDNYLIDSDGYPRFFTDTNEMYFQNLGKWYRETGGSGSTIDLLHGNNPHVGPYDNGFKYIDQLRVLIPNFSSVTVTAVTVNSGTTNLFTNYNQGRITSYSGETFVTATTMNGASLPSCVVVTTDIIPDPKNSDLTNDCGCETGLRDDSLRIVIRKADVLDVVAPVTPCTDILSTALDESTLMYEASKYQYNADGTIFKVNGVPVLLKTKLFERECCTKIGGKPTYTDVITVLNNVNNDVQSGYACCGGRASASNCYTVAACNWVPSSLPKTIAGKGGKFIEFTTLAGNGSKRFVVGHEDICPNEYTIAIPNITDPHSGDIGFGCQLTTAGEANYATLLQQYQTKLANGYCWYGFYIPIPPQVPSTPVTPTTPVTPPVVTAPTIAYSLYLQLNQTQKQADGTYKTTFTSSLTNLTDTQIICRNKIYQNQTNGYSVSISGSDRFTYEPLKVGVPVYFGSYAGVQVEKTLTGKAFIQVFTVTSTKNTGLDLKTDYIVTFDKGYVTSMIKGSSLPPC